MIQVTNGSELKTVGPATGKASLAAVNTWNRQ